MATTRSAALKRYSAAPPKPPGPAAYLHPAGPRRRQTAVSKVSRSSTLAHIELNAVDLACDIIARFGQHGDLPGAFFIDWIGVASDEGRHFLSLSERLKTLGAAYGDLPAHDGLWEAAENTAHDLLARLAVVPLVLEARGLDVTPMIKNSAPSMMRKRAI